MQWFDEKSLGWGVSILLVQFIEMLEFNKWVTRNIAYEAKALCTTSHAYIDPKIIIIFHLVDDNGG